jgi:hypothetical protein
MARQRDQVVEGIDPVESSRVDERHLRGPDETDESGIEQAAAAMPDPALLHGWLSPALTHGSTLRPSGRQTSDRRSGSSVAGSVSLCSKRLSGVRSCPHARACAYLCNIYELLSPVRPAFAQDRLVLTSRVIAEGIAHPRRGQVDATAAQ